MLRKSLVRYNLSYRALKNCTPLSEDLIRNILLFLEPPPQDRLIQRINRELQMHFVLYDIKYTIPMMRRLNMKWSRYATIYADLELSSEFYWWLSRE